MGYSIVYQEERLNRFSCILIGCIFYEILYMKKIRKLERDKNKGDISHPISVYMQQFSKEYLTIRPVKIAHEAKPNGLLTRGPWGRRV